MPPATFEIASPGIVRRIHAGVSIRDAAREAGATERTVRGWLTRGRRSPKSKYGSFASTIDQIRREQNGPPLSQFLKELPEGFDRTDLLRCVERAARAGSVEAIKHLLEMRPDLRPRGGGGGHQPLGGTAPRTPRLMSKKTHCSNDEIRERQ